MKLTKGLREEDDKCMVVIDVKKAHLCAPATRDVFIELPVEDGEDKSLCGYSKYSMYGTRDAAKNWSLEVEKTVKGMGKPMLIPSQRKAGGCNVPWGRHRSNRAPQVNEVDDQRSLELRRPWLVLEVRTITLHRTTTGTKHPRPKEKEN